MGSGSFFDMNGIYRIATFRDVHQHWKILARLIEDLHPFRLLNEFHIRSKQSYLFVDSGFLYLKDPNFVPEHDSETEDHDVNRIYPVDESTLVAKCNFPDGSPQRLVTGSSVILAKGRNGGDRMHNKPTSTLVRITLVEGSRAHFAPCLFIRQLQAEKF